MRREEICLLSGISENEFKSRNNRGQLPFRASGEYNPGAAWMLRAMRQLSADAISLDELAKQIDRAWPQLGRAIGRIAAGEEIYIALVAGKDAKGQGIVGEETGSLTEIFEALSLQLTVAEPATNAHAKRGYARRQRYRTQEGSGNFGGGPYENLSFRLVNVTRAYAEVVQAAKQNEVALPSNFPQRYGA